MNNDISDRLLISDIRIPVTNVVVHHYHVAVGWTGLQAGYTSNIPAAPIPPPMHIVTMP